MSGEKRKDHPFIAYQMMDKFTALEGREFGSTDEMFAFLLEEKLRKAIRLIILLNYMRRGLKINRENAQNSRHIRRGIFEMKKESQHF